MYKLQASQLVVQDDRIASNSPTRIHELVHELEVPLPLFISTAVTQPIKSVAGVQTINFYSIFSWQKFPCAKTYKQLDKNSQNVYFWPSNIFEQPIPEFVNTKILKPRDLKVFEVGSPVYAGSGLFMLDSETYALINPVYPYSVTGVDGLNDGEPYFENVRLAYDQAKHFSNLFGEQITISAVMK